MGVEVTPLSIRGEANAEVLLGGKTFHVPPPSSSMLRISMVGSMGLRSILHSYFGRSLVSSLMEKVPFALLFSIRVFFPLFYIGNGFSESLHLPK